MLRAGSAGLAKRRGAHGFAVFSKSDQRESTILRLITLGDEIICARSPSCLAYQPIVGSSPGSLSPTGRFASDARRLLAMGAFLPPPKRLASSAFDRRALEMAVAQLYAHEDVKLSINVSGTTACDQSWLQSFINYVRENREVAERMTVELTETAALHGFEENSRFVTRLRDMGCRVAIDDFGAGYTSFRNLAQSPRRHGQIDGDYVKKPEHLADNQLFVRTLVDLAKNSAWKTVPSGSARRGLPSLLLELGRRLFPGLYFGEPTWRPTG